jgi:hypothetical protein
MSPAAGEEGPSVLLSANQTMKRCHVGSVKRWMCPLDVPTAARERDEEKASVVCCGVYVVGDATGSAEEEEEEVVEDDWGERDSKEM